jgi:hypothetical protein
LINEVGLLKKEGLRFLHDVFEAWSAQSRKNDSLESIMEKVRWLKLQHYPVKIQACAVWDTVAALGYGRLRFVDETIPACVEQAIHALALNEERSQFEPLLFHRGEGQVLKQCWFLGSHSDVGGGNKKLGLANISLAWMMAQLKDLVYFDPSIVKSMTSQQHQGRPSEALKAEILDVSADGQPEAYKLEVAIPIQEFQAKSDVQIGTFATVQRIAGWRYREPFSSTRQTEETLHWTVPILLEKECVSTCVPLQRFGFVMQNIQTPEGVTNPDKPMIAPSTLFERNVLTNWIINESLQAIYKASSPSEELEKTKIDALDMIPIYAVLWQPEVWSVEDSANLGRLIHIGLKHGGQMRFRTPTHNMTADRWEQTVEKHRSWGVNMKLGSGLIVPSLPWTELGRSSSGFDILSSSPWAETTMFDVEDKGGLSIHFGPSGFNFKCPSTCKVLTGRITVPIADTLMSLDESHPGNNTHAESSLQASDSLAAEMVATSDRIYSTTRREDDV